MIKAKDGEVTFRGTRSNIMADAVTVLHALKEELSEEEYKDGYMYTVISDGVLFKQTANELFAVQVFNEI